MSAEAIGIVCTSCKHFTHAFILNGEFTLLDIQKAAENRTVPTTCESCGDPLPDKLEPEQERAEVRRDTERVRREVVKRSL